MKAWVLQDIGKISYMDVPEPECSGTEVLVQVKAAGICGSDIPRIYQTGAHVHPIIPGHEFSGVVAGVNGAGEEKWLGKRVGIFPLIPCGECLPCRKKKYEMCRNYSYLGSRRDGGFAEYVSVPPENLIELPDAVSFEEAAMLEPMAVAVHAVRRVPPEVGDTVAVCGLGTIGLFLVMFLKERGIKNILAVGNKEFQKEMALGLGVGEENYCDARQGKVSEWMMERTSGAGADVFFECVGKNETVSLALDNASPAGKVCLVGNPYGDMNLEKKVYWKILRNQILVTGTWNSSFTHEAGDDWHYVLCKLCGAVNPAKMITHRFALPELEQGMYIMRDKREDYIKVMAEIAG